MQSRLRESAYVLVCGGLGLLCIASVVYGSIWGGIKVQTWMKDYGSLLSAVLVAGITLIYVVITHHQLGANRKWLQLQFGAGATGPVIDLVQADLKGPPEYRVSDAYQYPSEYTKVALPRADVSTEIEPTTKCEMIQIRNGSNNPVEWIRLKIILHHGEVAKEFAYEHPKPIVAGESVVVAVWPVKHMPSYKLAVDGNYKDAVGHFPLRKCEVKR